MKAEKRLLFNAYWNSGLMLIAVGLLTVNKNILAGAFALISGVIILFKAGELLEAQNDCKNIGLVFVHTLCVKRSDTPL